MHITKLRKKNIPHILNMLNQKAVQVIKMWAAMPL